MNIGIVGAGIGGLSAAIALQKKGHDVQLFEQASQIKAVGAGLVLAANAMYALSLLGLDKRVEEIGQWIGGVAVLDYKGKVLMGTNFKGHKDQRIGQRFSVHRAELHAILRDELKPETLRLGQQCVRFSQHEKTIEVVLASGERKIVDVLVAADGLHSPLRQQIWPDTTLRYAGYTCWRGVIPQKSLSEPITGFSESWGVGRRFGLVPLAQDRLYWFACTNAMPRDAHMEAMTPDGLRRLFCDFHAPIPEVLKKTQKEEMHWADIYDLKPLQKFFDKHLVLLGDAAHGTTPNMGQGACMAIEDALVLAKVLGEEPRLESALQLYQLKRWARVQKVVKMSRQIGVVAHKCPEAFLPLRNALLRKMPASEKQLHWLFSTNWY